VEFSIHSAALREQMKGLVLIRLESRVKMDRINRYCCGERNPKVRARLWIIS
jgi:hypothetical protein